MSKKFERENPIMKMQQAQEIVLSLATQNIISDPEMYEQAKDQAQAIAMVQNMLSHGPNVAVVVQGGVVVEAYSNTPVNLAVVDLDNEDGQGVDVDGFDDPALVAAMAVEVSDATIDAIIAAVNRG